MASATRRGARLVQEDALGHWRHPRCQSSLMAVVADGLGSHGGGSHAARAAVRTAERLWRQRFAPDSCPAAFLQHWLAEAHAAVHHEARRIRHPARTAVVAMVAHEGLVHWLHVGDCRLYRIRDGRILERTKDHSLVQELFEAGHIDEDAMGSHPQQNELWQALGDDAPPEPSSGTADLAHNDVFLLCSDGFWENFQRAELERLACPPRRALHSSLFAAVSEAVRRSGPDADNSTAMLVTFEGVPPPPISLAHLAALTAIVACATAVAWKSGRSGNQNPGNHFV